MSRGLLPYQLFHRASAFSHPRDARLAPTCPSCPDAVVDTPVALEPSIEKDLAGFSRLRANCRIPIEKPSDHPIGPWSRSYSYSAHLLWNQMGSTVCFLHYLPYLGRYLYVQNGHELKATPLPGKGSADPALFSNERIGSQPVHCKSAHHRGPSWLGEILSMSQEDQRVSIAR